MNCAIGLRLLIVSSFLFAAGIFNFSFSQETDTSNVLSTVEVKTYGQVRKLRDVPAAVGYVGGQTLKRFNSVSVVQAVNTVPGVRMEERSPGSYRFNIRGSALRSPFGIRNVKVYYNDLPITDPGGQTYLNSFGYYNFGSIEILRGPGSSLYGASTGGVLLIEGLSSSNAKAEGEYTIGSYGLRNAYASVTTGDEQNKNRISYQHQVSDGYRYNSELKRDVLSWTGSFRISDKQLLKTTFLYSDLFYETPGALTKKEYDADPKAFRPAGFGFPSAEGAHAAVYQRHFCRSQFYTKFFDSIFQSIHCLRRLQ